MFSIFRKSNPALPTSKLPIAKLLSQQIIGTSHRIQGILHLVDHVRDSSANVLIKGESGTGKELVARALHETSPRADKPFVTFDCAALPHDLVDFELFGAEKGFAHRVEPRIGKFEAANGGTLFLDQIEELSLFVQAKIVRLLQHRAMVRAGSNKTIEVDVRIISTTNKDLLAKVKGNNFRVDLYDRLKVILIQIPSLREIPEDLPQIANHFLTKHCQPQEPKEFAPTALATLVRYRWPGNARELEPEVIRLVDSVRSKVILPEHLNPSIRNPLESTATPRAIAFDKSGLQLSLERQTLSAKLDAIAKREIEEALHETQGNKQEAARLMGLSRAGLIKMMKRLGVG